MIPTISLCMIVKNEEDYLRRCLDSVKNIVDQIVIVDTGSTDTTLDIAREYTSFIYNFEWCNNFAAARNEALKYASCDYILVLDADEYLDPGADIRTEVSTGFDYYFLKIHNILSNGRAINHTAIRLFANYKGLFYRNRLHEHLNTMDEGSHYTSAFGNIVINHTGYTEDMMNNREKNKRNLPLMIEEVNENPTAYNLFNMGRTYMALGENEKAIAYLKKAFPLSKELVIVPELISTLCYCLNEQKRYEEALQIIKDAVTLYPDVTDLFYLQGSIFMEAGYNKDAIISFVKCLELGDKGITVTEGNGSYMAHYRLAEIYENQYQISKSYEHIIEALRVNKTFSPAIKKYFEIVTRANVPLDDVYQNIELIYKASNVNELKLLLEILYVLRHPLLYKYLTEFKINVQDNVMAVGVQYNKQYDKAKFSWLGMNEIPEQNSVDILLLAFILNDRELFEKTKPLLNLSTKESKTLYSFVMGQAWSEESLNSSLEKLFEELISRLLELQEYEVFEQILNYIWMGSLEVKIRVCQLIATYGFVEVAIDLLAKLFESFPNDSRVIKLLGDICMNSNYLQDAQLFYNKLLHISPKYSSYERCYNLLTKMGENESSRVILEQIRKKFPISLWAKELVVV